MEVVSITGVEETGAAPSALAEKDIDNSRPKLTKTVSRRIFEFNTDILFILVSSLPSLKSEHTAGMRLR